LEGELCKDLFMAIGLGFLFIEIAFIQKFILILHHPLYAAALVISSFLLFAGLGSLYSQSLAGQKQSRNILRLAVSAITILGLGLLLFFNYLPDVIISLNYWLKALLSLALIAPLAFFMGMPFPLAVSVLSKKHENLIPWAWAVNGCASVISAVLATLLAIQFGFSVVIILALILYIVAAVSFPKVSVPAFNSNA